MVTRDGRDDSDTGLGDFAEETFDKVPAKVPSFVYLLSWLKTRAAAFSIQRSFAMLCICFLDCALVP